MAGLMALSVAAPAISVASAQPRPHSHRYYYDAQNNYTNNDNAVFVGGQTIMRFRVDSGGYSAHERAVETQERVNAILGQGPIYPSDITTLSMGVDAVVLVKGDLLFTADAQTASLNDDGSALDLANFWADKMRDVLPGMTNAN